jgi:hypothetical protein
LQRDPRRAVAAALVAYGLVGTVLLLALAATLAPWLANVDALASSRSDVERTIVATRVAFDGFGLSLADGERSATRAAAAARSSAAAARQLSSAMSISIFGAQPLLSLATGFQQQASDLEALGSSLDVLAASLGKNQGDVGTIRDQLALLAGRAAAIERSEPISPLAGPLLIAAFAWLLVQALACATVGFVIWRRGTAPT